MTHLVLAALLALAASSCAPRPLARTPATANGFTPGRSYVATQSIALGRRGHMLILIGGRSEDPGTTVIGSIEPGTTVAVRRIVSYDSVTHGAITYPEGEIRSGRWQGRMVELAQDGLRPRFAPSTP